MKYIAFFDVPDETTPIDDTAELVCCGKVSEVYAKVKPYNPSGDLISREDLKAEFKRSANSVRNWKEGALNSSNDESAIRADAVLAYLTEVKGIIDNAPTVELSPVINMKPLTAEEKQGLIDALKKSRLKVIKLDDEGIRGEWARYDEWVNGEYTGGFYHVNCPVIEEGYALYSRWETRFCPNCGAPMKSGGEKE